jgi:hypothetical protein
VRVLRPGMSALTEEVRSLPVGSLIVWADLAVYQRTGPNRWSCPERDQIIDDVDISYNAWQQSKPFGVVVRIGSDWTVIEDKLGDAAAFAGAVAEFARTDPAFRDALRRTTSELRDLADAIDQLDPRTRR